MDGPREMEGDVPSRLKRSIPAGWQGRCWFHKTANVLDCLPKRLQPHAKTLIHEITAAPTRRAAAAALEIFREEYGAKYPKALQKLDKDWSDLTA